MRSVAEIFSSHEERDAQGRHVNGTDKHGANHQYGPAYESLFTCAGPRRIGEGPASCWETISIRDVVKLVLEVGVADGSCLLAWREVFPNATIVGMDIHHSDKAHGERIEFHKGDQRSQDDCERAAAGRQFDLIIDDATHHLDATLLTLFYLWPFVRPGGLYVLEEFPGGPVRNITAMWPFVEIVPTQGPFGGNEPLVVLRKPI